MASWKKNSIPASPSGAGRRRQHLLLTTSAAARLQISQLSAHLRLDGVCRSFTSLIMKRLLYAIPKGRKSPKTTRQPHVPSGIIAHGGR